MRRPAAARVPALVGAMGLAVVGLLAAAGATPAAETAGFTTTVFAPGGGSLNLSKPDDIAFMHRSIFVSWQNGVGPKGEPAANGNLFSTVAQYSLSGRLLNHWQLKGRCDGMTADTQHERIIATVNEDGSSSLYVIKLSDGPQLVHYAYSPNPPVHGGGTDAPLIYRGQLFISASNPSDVSNPAVYRARLSGTTATLTPVFFDNSIARVANANDPAHGTQTTLALTDPDSNFAVPRSSPRFAGDFVLDSQGDGQLIFAHDPGGADQKLAVLSLSSEAGPAGASTAVDDTVWATSSRGTLFATDGSTTVYAIRGDFKVGTAFSAVSPGNAGTPPATSIPNFLAALDLNTGALTRVAGVTIQPKGLVFVRGDGGDHEGDA